MSESVSQSVSDKVTYGAVLGQLKICYLKIKDLVCLAQCSLQFDKNFSYYSDLLYQENLENLLGKKILENCSRSFSSHLRGLSTGLRNCKSVVSIIHVTNETKSFPFYEERLICVKVLMVPLGYFNR